MLNFGNKFVYHNLSKLITRTNSYSHFVKQKVEFNKRFPTNTNESLAQEELLSTAVENGKIPSINEWKTIKDNVISHGRNITNVNFDAKAVGFCITHKNYEAAKSFMSYIQNENAKPNLAAVGKFMRLYYVCNEETKISNEHDEALIISMYKDLQRENPVFASITAENVIHALSLTKEWKDCLKLLENMKITAGPSASTYSAVIKAAFENDEYDIGWMLMNEMIAMDRLPTPIVYHSWLNEVKKTNHNIQENIERLLTFFADNDLQPSKDVTDSIQSLLQPLSYTGVYTSVSSKGVCNCCKQSLQEITVNKEEFENLRSVFIDNVIIGKNLFNKSTPEELEKFKQFVTNVGSCDMVVDGLNVAYSAGTKKSADVYAKMLANVVNHFRQKNKKVLVLGRLHMNKWPKQYMSFIRSSADVFLAQNLSQDDPFLLYATMSSGLGTGFLSRDFMRGHAYLLMEPELKKLFRRWQQLHQHSLVYVESNGKTHIKPPYPMLPTVQTHKTGWHIPYVNVHMANPPASLEPPKNWLCIRKT